MASSTRGKDKPRHFPLRSGKGWLSYRNPYSLWAAPWPPRAALAQGRAGSRLCFPTLVPSAPSSAPGHGQCRRLRCTQHIVCPSVSRGHRQAPRESSLGAGSSDQSPGAGRDGRKHCLNSPASLQTLEAMDTMLETMVLSFPASRVSEELQNVLQVWHG